MTDLLIDVGPWQVAEDGGLRAPYRVTLGANPTQDVLVVVEPATVAELGLPAEVDTVAHRLDEHARAALGRLAASGRVANELRLSAFDLSGVLDGSDPPPDEGTADEPGPEA